MQYEIIEKCEVPCRIIDIKVCTPRNNKDFLVYFIGEYDSGKFLYSFPDFGYTDGYKINEIQNDIQNRTKFYVYRSTIRPSVDMYRKITWNDVNAGKHSRDHLGEIERDKYGYPVPYSKIVVYTNLLTEDLRNEINPEDLPEESEITGILDNDYVAIDSPSVYRDLRFNNKKSYQERLKRERQEQEKTYSDYYDSYEEHYDNDFYTSEEDQIMDALENGDAEVFGF